MVWAVAIRRLEVLPWQVLLINGSALSAHVLGHVTSIKFIHFELAVLIVTNCTFIPNRLNILFLKCYISICGFSAIRSQVEGRGEQSCCVQITYLANLLH